MNSTLLIHAIVRQTTVLLAALATASGQRAQLASVANLVFADLVRELREQGLGNKVIADMFGLALRTYHRRVARLCASRTVHGRSLWDAVLAHVQQRGPLTRTELEQRFARDDEAILRSVVLDLIESGLLREESRDDAGQLYAVEAGKESSRSVPGELEGLVLVTVHRNGPLNAKAVVEVVGAEAEEIEATLARLETAGFIAQHEHGGELLYSCDTCVIQFGDEAGWEGAVFDHYQALVVAIAMKVRKGSRRAELADAIGGSTFAFDLWRGHPLEQKVLGYLRSMREQGMALRQELERYNEAAPPPVEAARLRVISYVGQSVTETGDGDGHED